MALALSGTAMLRAGGNDPPAAKDREEELAAIKKDFQNALLDVRAALKEAKTIDDRSRAIEPLFPLWRSALKLADAAEDDVSLQAALWVLTSSKGAPLSTQYVALIEEVAQSKTAKAHAEVGAQALLVLAQLFQAEADRLANSNPKAADSLARRAEGYCERILKDHGEASGAVARIAREAKGILYELRHLAVGKLAPDVEGTDLDDKKAKLSDFRGKVVVLDIWATWCRPCRDMIPHEREMVKRLEGKPFVLLSVSADAKKETLVKFLEKEEMPWVHWHNGAKGGTLETYQVRFFPTIYVLDAKGIIRYKNIRGSALEEAVEKLLQETESNSGGGDR
ncbi:MAG: TlpA family protein disulfide reductase [Gemmataceae bacterium]|nr:TlpA family protein disulfide reductase [Gemmataceae bacterium]MDW8265671.1 TlpA disulfide reductase family protein [Gemmataceae bacterium]